MSTALKITDLTKRYKDGPLALDKVSLEIKKGEFFGLLGPNGAGKSTLINIIASVVNKTHGGVKVFEHELDEDPTAIKFNIGVVPQEISFDPFLSVEETLVYQSGYFGIRDNMKYIEEVLVRLNLIDKRKTGTRKLSGGMKRRLLIAKALIHKPKLLILDEPTAGVDVELRHTLWDYVTQLNKDGMTILLTTHYLEEAESLCERIAIVDQGKIKTIGKTQELIDDLSGQKILTLILKDCIKRVPQELENYRPELTADGHALQLTLIPDDAEKVFAQIAKSGIDIVNFTLDEQSLEDVFLKLTYEQHEK